HLLLEGEKGSSKTTTMRLLLNMIDPSEGDLAPPPRDETDATISASEAGILAFDNLSGCRGDISDLFCRFSTGQAYKTRTLYQTRGLTLVTVKLPIMLNGIDPNITRGDLLERCITLRLPRITNARRT